MNITLSKVRAEAKRLGAEYTYSKIGNSREVRVEAPHRMRWACSHIHELVHELAYAGQDPERTKQWDSEDAKDIMERMKYGLVTCVEADCEWCSAGGAED